MKGTKESPKKDQQTKKAKVETAKKPAKPQEKKKGGDNKENVPVKKNAPNKNVAKPTPKNAKPIPKGKPQPKKPAPKKRLTPEEKQKQKDKERNQKITRRVKMALDYVQKWKKDRTNWRFHKTNQTSLVKNFLDTKLIPDSAFPDVLNYFRNMMGNDREAARNAAAVALSSASNEKDKKKVMDRARQVSSLWK